jgi:hypothetical protein
MALNLPQRVIVRALRYRQTHRRRRLPTPTRLARNLGLQPPAEIEAELAGELDTGSELE